MNVAFVGSGLPTTAEPLSAFNPETSPPAPHQETSGQTITDGNSAEPTSYSTSASTAAARQVKPAYPPPAEIPTQQGPDGLRFDFNGGCRVLAPASAHPWRIRLSDLNTGNILFQTEIKEGHVNSAKRYFVRIRLEVWQQDERVLCHDYSAADREVLIQFPVGTIGDTLGWFPYAVKFKELHRCRLTCGMGEKLIPLFRDAYPDITFLPHEEIKPERYYATYSLGCSSTTKTSFFNPVTSASSGCIVPRGISSASIRRKCRRVLSF